MISCNMYLPHYLVLTWVVPTYPCLLSALTFASLLAMIRLTQWSWPACMLLTMTWTWTLCLFHSLYLSHLEDADLTHPPGAYSEFCSLAMSSIAESAFTIYASSSGDQPAFWLLLHHMAVCNPLSSHLFNVLTQRTLHPFPDLVLRFRLPARTNRHSFLLMLLLYLFFPLGELGLELQERQQLAELGGARCYLLMLIAMFPITLSPATVVQAGTANMRDNALQSSLAVEQRCTPITWICIVDLTGMIDGYLWNSAKGLK